MFFLDERAEAKMNPFTLKPQVFYSMGSIGDTIITPSYSTEKGREDVVHESTNRTVKLDKAVESLLMVSEKFQNMKGPTARTCYLLFLVICFLKFFSTVSMLHTRRRCTRTTGEFLSLYTSADAALNLEVWSKKKSAEYVSVFLRIFTSNTFQVWRYSLKKFEFVTEADVTVPW